MDSAQMITKTELIWWRRGELEYSEALKTRILLIFRDAKNAENGRIAATWNVSGTRLISRPTRIFDSMGAIFPLSNEKSFPSTMCARNLRVPRCSLPSTNSFPGFMVNRRASFPQLP